MRDPRITTRSRRRGPWWSFRSLSSVGFADSVRYERALGEPTYATRRSTSLIWACVRRRPRLVFATVTSAIDRTSVRWPTASSLANSSVIVDPKITGSSDPTTTCGPRPFVDSACHDQSGCTSIPGRFASRTLDVGHDSSRTERSRRLWATRRRSASTHKISSSSVACRCAGDASSLMSQQATDRPRPTTSAATARPTSFVATA